MHQPLAAMVVFKHDHDVSRGTTWRWLVTNCPRGVEKHRWFAYFSQLAQGVLLNVHVVKSNQHSPYFDRYFEEALKEQIKFVKAG